MDRGGFVLGSRRRVAARQSSQRGGGGGGRAVSFHLHSTASARAQKKKGVAPSEHFFVDWSERVDDALIKDDGFGSVPIDEIDPPSQPRRAWAEIDLGIWHASSCSRWRGGGEGNGACGRKLRRIPTFAGGCLGPVAGLAAQKIECGGQPELHARCFVRMHSRWGRTLFVD